MVERLQPNISAHSFWVFPSSRYSLINLCSSTSFRNFFLVSSETSRPLLASAAFLRDSFDVFYPINFLCSEAHSRVQYLAFDEFRLIKTISQFKHLKVCFFTVSGLGFLTFLGFLIIIYHTSYYINNKISKSRKVLKSRK